MLFRLNTPHLTSTLDVDEGQREANMGSNKGWVGATCCFLLFTVVFLSQKMDVFIASETGFRGGAWDAAVPAAGYYRQRFICAWSVALPFFRRSDGHAAVSDYSTLLAYTNECLLAGTRLCHERGVLESDGGVGIFVRLRFLSALFSLEAKTPKARDAPLVRYFVDVLLKQVQVRFGISFEIVAATDVFFV